MTTKDAIDVLAAQLERNVYEYQRLCRYGDSVAETRKQAAYEDARLLRKLDTEVGELANEYLRENDI